MSFIAAKLKIIVQKIVELGSRNDFPFYWNPYLISITLNYQII